MKDHVSADLLARWQTGDQQAAGELFGRYAQRLVALARGRLSTPLSRRIDPEDVVQSAYRSFFADVREGRFDFRGGDQLWQLLVVITLHKLQEQVQRSSAQKRALSRERPLGDAQSLRSLAAHVRAHQPSPVEAVALVEEVEHLMRQLGPLQRRMLELRLQGHSVDEIATATGRTERTVRRVLDQVKAMLRPEGPNP
jgi:RNA polymerase sigma factor (sigma-70 family)